MFVFLLRVLSGTLPSVRPTLHERSGLSLLRRIFGVLGRHRLDDRRSGAKRTHPQGIACTSRLVRFTSGRPSHALRTPYHKERSGPNVQKVSAIAG